ncbi:MAG: PTS sugar transporter subunit IIC, partial [Finegoldia magna]|uniref:PTS sugar transporter subunit IIC n=1 Tax=Finegoldia magna TaxID=1260 RepID=UPI00290DEE6B
TIFSGNVKWSKNAIEQGKYTRNNLIANSTYIAFAVAGFMIGLLAALSRPGLQAFVEALPNWLINGFSVAGGLIPAIGFAMIMSVMLEKSLTPYVLLGYICAAYLELPTMAVAMVGTVFALIQYYGKDKTIVGEKSIRDESQTTLMEEEDFSNGI